MAEIEIFNPTPLSAPRGTYSHVARVRPGATLVVVAGQVAVGEQGERVGADDFDGQCTQVYGNIGAAVREAGGDWRNVIQFMTFLTRKDDIAGLRAWREREFPKLFPDGAYPPNTLLVVSALASDDLLLEVQAIAAI
ncbi:MAG TPA: RidA family protein [Candidatus Limnocylindria bacterium]